MTAFNCNYLLKGPSSKYSHTGGYGTASGFWGDTVSPFMLPTYPEGQVRVQNSWTPSIPLKGVETWPTPLLFPVPFHHFYEALVHPACMSKLCPTVPGEQPLSDTGVHPPAGWCPQEGWVLGRGPCRSWKGILRSWWAHPFGPPHPCAVRRAEAGAAQRSAL